MSITGESILTGWINREVDEIMFRTLCTDADLSDADARRQALAHKAVLRVELCPLTKCIRMGLPA